MATLSIRDRANEVVGEVELAAEVFERPVKPSVLHEAVRHHRAVRRSGNHATKTRGEVVGSSRKPWRQKGTGRGRQGDRRSPIWRKGGVTFGPQPRDHGYRLPRRKQRLALKMALSSKFESGNILVLDELAVDAPKTKRAVELLRGLGLEGKTLIYDPEASRDLALAARNIPGVTVVSGFGLSAYDLLLHDNLLTSQAGIARIDEVLR